ncbi:hypothetical protein Cdeb_02853 [Caldibacillus debilis GB1]|jgi:hypothetical protein|uniref:Uncharacterized protein n=1 Tax=Caldibacillus debilis GB1 TaxID=1339248 RepID=A0A420VJ75_9BACI|nr:hypothetical protein Cdeb_02853 [Caldibacillus debilis GB1]
MKEPGREWPGRPLICILRNMPESRGKFKPSASDGQGSTKFAASHTARDFQAWPDIALAGNFSRRNRLFFIKKKDGRRNRMSGHLFPVFVESGFGAES